MVSPCDNTLPKYSSAGIPYADIKMISDKEFEGIYWATPDCSAVICQFMIVGDDITIAGTSEKDSETQVFVQRNIQAFGKGTTRILQNTTIGVVGCSGTGSIVVEQLVRLGVGKLTLVDPDRVEDKNLNRIINSTVDDIGKYKTEVLAEATKKMGLGTDVVAINKNLLTPQAVRAIAECDIVFGCMDGAEGRHVLNRISAFYLIPYFDVGVRLDADGNGGINDICGQVNYVRPDGSSLLSRGVITREALDAEGLRNSNPEEYKSQRKEKYIKGAEEDRPAVITPNMFYASMAVHEFLARIHPYRHDANNQLQYYSFSLGKSFLQNFMNTDKAEKILNPCPELRKYVGRGDIKPLLAMPKLSERIG